MLIFRKISFIIPTNLKKFNLMLLNFKKFWTLYLAIFDSQLGVFVAPQINLRIVHNLTHDLDDEFIAGVSRLEVGLIRKYFF